MNLKREGPLALTGILTIIILLDYYTTISIFSDISGVMQKWAVIIFTFSLGMGAVSICQLHMQNIIKRTKKKWVYSSILLGTFIITLLLGLSSIVVGKAPMLNPSFAWIQKYIYTTLSATMYSTTAFYIFSAAYRAFRARTWLAAVLLTTGFFVMTKNMTMIYAILPSFSTFGDWLFSFGNTGALRGIRIGVAIGMVFYVIRYVTGKEKIAV